MLDGKRLLFLGAHCDDVELGCGGTIAQLTLSANTSINIRVLSQTLVDGHGNIVGERDLAEQSASFAKLGLNEQQYRVENISGGQVFPEHRQKILDYLYHLKKELRPDLIFTMSSADVHQDHRTLHDASVKAFNRQDILEYGILNSARHMRRDIYIPFDERAMSAKLASLACFQSMNNPELSLVDYFDPEVIRSEARVHGLACGEELAEGFGCFRMRIAA